MRSHTLLSLLVVLYATIADAATCPYSQLPSTSNQISVADKSLCPSSSLTCVVDRSCKFIGTLDNTTWNAIGSYSNLPLTQSSWSFNGGQVCVNLNAASLPSQLKTVKFSNMTFPPGPITPTLPSQLKELFIEITNLTSIPISSLPSTLTLLFLGVNYLSKPAEIGLLPNTITHLSLEGNDFTSLSNLDWTTKTQVYLCRNSKLRVLSNISFSSSIRSLNLENLSITSWTMSTATFHALNTTLQPNNTAEDSTRSDGIKTYIGYNYYGLTITTDATECTYQNGRIEELWPDKSMRNFKYSKEVFKVCVLNDPATTSPLVIVDPTTTSGLSTGVIVGIAAGGIVIVAIIAFLCLRRRRVDESSFHPNISTKGNTQFETVTTPPVVNHSTDLEYQLQALELVRIPEGDVYMQHQIGSGAFACVHVGAFQGQRVAIKSLHKSRSQKTTVQNFVEEILLMSQFDSPYVVNLIGASWTRPDDLKCVMEYMDGGDLKDFLDRHTLDSFPWKEKYVHIHSIAEALCYLHSMSIIHRDIKSRNILLDSMKGTKLTDFGISKEDIQQTMTIGVGTFRWMAPEVLQDKGYTVAADIYSFGMLLSEFDTHHIPYEDMKNPTTGQPVADSAIILKVVAGTIRPSFTADCPNWIHTLANQCLQHDPNDRPSSMQVSHTVRMKLKELSSGLFSL